MEWRKPKREGLQELAAIDYRACCLAIGVGYRSRFSSRDRDPSVSGSLRRHTADAWGGILDKAGVPNAPLLTTDQVATHPQTRALDMMVRCSDDDIEVVGIPLAFDGARPRARTAAPAPGQHNILLKTAASKRTTHAK
jgi:crotonobetainyl-CoA:carnitine CoA-transferase CaiB-like acyl-CoA transferase